MKKTRGYTIPAEMLERIKREVSRLNEERKLGLDLSTSYSVIEQIAVMTFGLLGASRTPIPNGPYDALIIEAAGAWKRIAESQPV